MKHILKSLLVLILVSSASLVQAQKIETTYSWFSQDHSAWKVQPTQYANVIVGTKFFEPSNNTLYVQGFDMDGKSRFTKGYPAPGITALNTFWKSFTATPDLNKVFAVSSSATGANRVFALLADANTGNKIWELVANLPFAIQFGGVTNAKNGGWIATGGNNSGNPVAVKFDHKGVVLWTKVYPVSAFGWAIIRLQNDGYVLAGTRQIIKIDEAGNQVWAATLNLPLSPDGSAYTYTEFEEIMELPNSKGIVVTGSCFSNSHSGVYTAAFSLTGSQLWRTVHAPQNTASSGTPVSWTNNAIMDGDYILTSWRTGPVSSGGQLYYQRQFVTGEKAFFSTPLGMGNAIPVQEAFLIKHNGKYVVGGTRGGYSAAYSYINNQLPLLPDRYRRSDDENLPLAGASSLNSGLVRVNFNNTEPVYKLHQASRVFNSEMRVFPNPTSGLINVGGKIEPGAKIRVTDMMGRTILEKMIPNGEVQVQLDLQQYGKGLYNVEMMGPNQKVSKKIALQ